MGFPNCEFAKDNFRDSQERQIRTENKKSAASNKNNIPLPLPLPYWFRKLPNSTLMKNGVDLIQSVHSLATPLEGHHVELYIAC